MSKILACIDYDSATQTCTAEAWVDQSSFSDYLPTVAEANAVGFAFASSLFLIAAAVRSFKPPKE